MISARRAGERGERASDDRILSQTAVLSDFEHEHNTGEPPVRDTASRLAPLEMQADVANGPWHDRISSQTAALSDFEHEHNTGEPPVLRCPRRSDR